jgi:hypothetical protein
MSSIKKLVNIYCVNIYHPRTITCKVKKVTISIHSLYFMECNILWLDPKLQMVT